jgi:opacity protein-like surface antigen
MKKFEIIAGMSIAIGLATLSSNAFGQSVDPNTSLVEGPGVKIGEGTVLHPSFGAETGAISNMFYTDTNTSAAGVFRVLFEGSIGSLSVQRRATSSAEAAANEEEQAAAKASQGDLEYRAQLNLGYSEFISTNTNVRQQRDLSIGARFKGVAFPQRTWRFGFEDFFQRITRPTNFESAANVNRDINDLRLALQYEPAGRSISGSVSYTNTLDIFEASTQSFASRFLNNFNAHANWQFLPVTKFFADVQLGFFSGLSSDTQKVSSVPLRATVGIQTAITTSTTVSLTGGYGQGFYSSGPDFLTYLIDANVGYRYSPMGRLSLSYTHTAQDSINASFFTDHAFRVGVQQDFVPFALTASAEAKLRTYEGIFRNVPSSTTTRSDVIFAVTAGAHYNFRDWLAATLNYDFATVQTDFTYMTDGLRLNPSFTRHQLLLGIRAAL